MAWVRANAGLVKTSFSSPAASGLRFTCGLACVVGHCFYLYFYSYAASGSRGCCGASMVPLLLFVGLSLYSVLPSLRTDKGY